MHFVIGRGVFVVCFVVIKFEYMFSAAIGIIDRVCASGYGRYVLYHIHLEVGKNMQSHNLCGIVCMVYVYMFVLVGLS